MSSTPPVKRGFFSRGSSRSATPVPDQTAQLSKQLGGTSLGAGGAAAGDNGLDGDEEEGTLEGVDDAAAELQGADVESESGKFRALLGILRKTISVKDLSSVRISLPATMMEPIGNLEHWTYIDRPDYFAALADEGMDELEKMLAILRWLFTKETKFVRHPIAKPFNSVLGESFHCYYDTPVLELHPKKKHPLPAVHLDQDPHPEILACAGRGSSNTTSAAPLKSLPSVTSIYATGSHEKTNGTSAAPAAAAASRTVASSSSSTRSNVSSRSVASTAASSTASTSSDGPAREPRTARVVIVNEQTSHHPPISHFVAEARVAASASAETTGQAPKPRIVRLRGVDQLSAKFTGANVRVVPGAHNKGLFLDLADGEEYRITHPTAAVAGLLRASPYATITESTTITCLKPATGDTPGSSKRLRAIVQYVEESWITRPRFLVEGVVYESSPNEAASDPQADVIDGSDKRFTKVKQVPKDRVVGTFEGNWRGEIKWTKKGESTSTTLVDLLPLAVVPKSVAPLEAQAPFETRKVWEPVVNALHKKDYNTASKEKQRIEQEQRDKAEERKKKGESYRPRFFEPEPEDVMQWDGRPILSEEGKAALERDFKADYPIYH
ncbi:hypothetical protein JCM10908_003460 [Rhodotorula pacifica]|uniref:uncharacterized protein n=1 Tax=Rhodotorula pacifica TaxID=1495444 RepID=UPI00316B175D